jgi:DNA-binding response OmpR family regulator
MGARILIVDDDPDTLKLVELTLKTAGHHVELASDGDAGYDLIRQGSFDLILLDVMMPNVSGFDLMQRLNEEGQPYPPIVIFTARNRPEDQETGFRLGARNYIIKPVTRGQLLDIIQDIKKTD